MKKAISLFLAVSVLCFATSALAAIGTGTVTGDVRNGQTTMPQSYTLASMPCFRTGDTITFTVSGVTSGRELTLISYKYNASLTNATVQYINQYTVSDDVPISYTVREQASGVYVVQINDESGTVATFYYKVGNVSVSTVTQSGEVTYPTYGTPYLTHQYSADKWSIAFIGKATIDGSLIKFGDVNATFGFEFSDTSTGTNIHGKSSGQATGTGHTVTGAALDSFFADLLTDNGVSVEINGSYSVLYGLTLYNVPNSSYDKVTARAVMN